MNIARIKSDNFAAEVNLSRGGNCISLKNKKYCVNILREPDYSKELDNPFLYGMPILFPVNRISDGTFEFEGRKYTFPINEPETGCHLHGLLHKAEFELTDIGESFIKCKYKSDKLYEFFPHEFSIEITYSLSEKGMTQETRICNLSNSNMPVLLGFHTTFNIAFVTGTFNKNVCVFAEVGDVIERNKNYLPTGRILPSDNITHQFNNGEFRVFGNKISRHYKADKDGRIELTDRESGLKIIYENDKKFGWRLFYDGDAKEFICLEPQTCMVNCQNSEFGSEYTGFDYIKPNSYKKYISKICVEEI